MNSLLSKTATRKATADDVACLYRLLLDREPSPSALATYAKRDLLSVVAELAALPDHRQLMRRALAGDVVRLYRELLRREPESDDVIAQRVGRPLVDVALEFAQSEEARVRARAATAADVESLYHQVLERPPENAAAVNTRVGLPLLDVALEVSGSIEARTRQDIELEELQEWCMLFLGARAAEGWARELLRVLRSFRFRRVVLLDHLLHMHLRRLGIASAPGLDPAERPPHMWLRERPNYSPPRHFGSMITLIVPTIDSDPWVRSVVDFYDEIGIRPLYAVDSRTTDGTREILKTTRQNWIEIAADDRRVEALLPHILTQVGTPWVLRMDDDELPTPEMLQFCDDVVERAEPKVWGFPRLCLRWDPARCALDYSRFLTVGVHADLDRQWRLFRPDGVRLQDAVHTPGFDSAASASAPPGALILHFDWVVRSAARRRDKAASYEAQSVSSAHHRHHVLYEDIPDEWHRFEALDHLRFLAFARKIYHASA